MMMMMIMIMMIMMMIVMIGGSRGVSGMRNGGGIQSTRRKRTPVPILHHKSHMI
jgi:hypothetical protein